MKHFGLRASLWIPQVEGKITAEKLYEVWHEHIKELATFTINIEKSGEHGSVPIHKFVPPYKNKANLATKRQYVLALFFLLNITPNHSTLSFFSDLLVAYLQKVKHPEIANIGSSVFGHQHGPFGGSAAAATSASSSSSSSATAASPTSASFNQSVQQRNSYRNRAERFQTGILSTLDRVRNSIQRADEQESKRRKLTAISPLQALFKEMSSRSDELYTAAERLAKLKSDAHPNIVLQSITQRQYDSLVSTCQCVLSFHQFSPHLNFLTFLFFLIFFLFLFRSAE